jgi:pyruvate ferredoxin oxidoreductase delta subunit
MKGKEITIEIVPGGWFSKPLEAPKTGTWRTFRPLVDRETCNGCRTCEMLCPENTIIVVEGVARVDYEYCKGCGVCANECPFNAITMKLEAGYTSRRE